MFYTRFWNLGCTFPFVHCLSRFGEHSFDICDFAFACILDQGVALEPDLVTL